MSRAATARLLTLLGAVLAAAGATAALEEAGPAAGSPPAPAPAAAPPAGARAGAPAPAAPAAPGGHWAFRPLARPEVPAVGRAEWPRGAADRFILGSLEREGLPPSPEAARRVLARRATLCLTGLPPAPGELEAFAADPGPDAHERLVDRLLASPRLGERWASHWLDVVRFAETNGFETNTPRADAWPYRDWTIAALNADMPYPEFVRAQLAGDACGEDAATGFLVAGAFDTVKSPDVELTREQRQGEIHDMIGAAGGAFLGLTLGCARCHDHKFDPVSQRDYYALAAVFAGVGHGSRAVADPDAAERERRAAALGLDLARLDAELRRFEPLADPSRGAGKAADAGEAGGAPPPRAAVNARRNADRFAPVEARYVRFTALAANLYEPCLDELEVYAAGEPRQNLALASSGARTRSSGDYPGNPIHKLEHVNDGLYGNSRSWISSEVGRGWVEVELREKALIDCVVWGRDRKGEYQDRLATDYRIEVAAEPGAWRLVASAADRRPYRQGVEPQAGAPPAGQPPGAASLLERRRLLEGEIEALLGKKTVYAGVFAQPGPTHRLERGDVMQERETVAPAAVAGLGAPLALPADAPERERRLALAAWITAAENPLPARVLANRIWLGHFGEGIVATPSDFGANGAPPSHPELLDWLAAELVRGGWSLKRLHRLVVLSAAFRQGSAPVPAAAARDAGCRLLWRFPPRRLEAEAIRDAILFTSGTLDLAMGGPGYEVFEPNTNYVRVYNPKATFTPREWRRMVYQYRVRMEQDGTFGAFDCPDAGQSCPKRSRSTTPLQALNLLNSSFVVEQAGFFSRRVAAEAGSGSGAGARRAFVVAFGREPDAGELAAAVELLRAHGPEVLARALFNANEFIYLE